MSTMSNLYGISFHICTNLYYNVILIQERLRFDAFRGTNCAKNSPMI